MRHANSTKTHERISNPWDDVKVVKKKGKIELDGILTDDMLKNVFLHEPKMTLDGRVPGADSKARFRLPKLNSDRKR